MAPSDAKPSETRSVQEDHGLTADKPTELPTAGWKDVALRVKEEIRDDHTSLAAAGVAFFGFLAFIPGLAALVSVYGLFADPDQVQRRVQSLAGALPNDARDLIVDQLSRLTEKSGASLGFGVVIGIVLALWAASSGMAHLIEAINVAYDEKDERGMVARRGAALAMTLLVLVLAVLSIAGLGFAGSIGDSNAALGWVTRIVAYLVLGVLVVLVLSVLYRHGADRDEPKWRWVAPGAVFSLIGFLVVSIGFNLYVSNFGSYDKTYGSLAAIVVVLFWLYLSAFVVIVGAQLDAELEHQTARDTTQGSERPMGTRDAEMADTVGHRT